MKMKMKIEGLSELRDQIMELPKATGKAVLRRALIKAADPIEKEAEQKAPVRKGGKARLQTSINISTKLSGRQSKLWKREIGSIPRETIGGFKSDPQSAVYVFVGAGPLKQAHMQEFGTAHHGPHPFMRPAWEGNKMKALQTMIDEIGNEIEKARARIARKTARLLAAGQK